jgi:hypothetical protein
MFIFHKPGKLLCQVHAVVGRQAPDARSSVEPILTIGDDAILSQADLPLLEVFSTIYGAICSEFEINSLPIGNLEG